jgi:hypothetical protein
MKDRTDDTVARRICPGIFAASLVDLRCPKGQQTLRQLSITIARMHRRSCLIDGEEWIVYDVRPLGRMRREPALAAGWLCFEGGLGRRRFFSIPEGWERLPEPQLVGLWHAATPAKHFTRRGHTSAQWFKTD